MRNTRKSGQILWSKKRLRPILRSGRGCRTSSNTSHRIPARVIEADKVNVHPVCDGLLVASQSHSLRTRRKIMSFFERLKTAASAEWQAYTEHPFTEGLAGGSLPRGGFRATPLPHYPFLLGFARAYALAVYKSPSLADMREAAAGLSAILDVEMNLHVKLCGGWGLSAAGLETTPPAVRKLAQTRSWAVTG